MKKIFYFFIAFVCINCSKDDDSSGDCFVCDYAESVNLNGEMELIPFSMVSDKICAGADFFGMTYSKAMLQALLQDPESSCEECNCRLE
ncbi:MAG: hypothetical protein CBD72_01470 [Flavobacteriaceae bacterium TMED212]|nr:MAG: hypothetical protein CBD72_01470 [Flavobacteriaceae bacterium TMED212]|tara:strand:+ start:685 stop:951 length:267 start_codon:yes stop_codon:yes gene_type:complete